MGYSTSTMIGPYMVITKTPLEEIEKVETKKTCTNKYCEKHGFDVGLMSDCVSFCGYCGSKVEEIKLVSTIKEALNFDQVKYDYGNEDIFYKPDYVDVYIPNLYYDGRNSKWIIVNQIVEIPDSEESISVKKF